jgi:hypothetical protein
MQMDTMLVTETNFSSWPDPLFLYIGGRRLPTKAYTVVCLQQHASTVDAMVKNVYQNTSHYVKFCLCHKNVQAF